MQFTEKFIQSLKPKSARYDIREKSGDGFAIRVATSGEKSFIYMYHFEGRKRRMTLGRYPHMTLADARKQHRAALKLLENNQDPAEEVKKVKLDAKNSSSVSALIEEYLEIWAKPRKRSWEEDQRILYKDVRPKWGKHKAKDITKRDVILLLETIVKRNAPITANRTLACIRRMFNFGVERDLIPTSPCATVIAPSKENRCERYLTADEIRVFWYGLTAAPMSELTKLALKLQLVTAQRKGEIVSAEWSDLSTNVWTIPAEKAKNGKAHRVPLSELALELLGEIKKLSKNTRWLFPASHTVKEDTHMTGEAIDHALRRSKEIFRDIQRFSPHTLRATATSHMASMRISSEVLSRILNHSKKGVTDQHYNQYSYDDEKRHALDAWTRQLKKIINGENESSNIVSLKTAI